MDKNTFIISIAPAARKVSVTTGLSYELILAQAAQETGWGAKILPGTNNLFNIKADSSWTGSTATFTVPEFINGKYVNVSATFRVYASFDDAIQDRINFLSQNPRYAPVFASGTKGNLVAEANALQAAGYATDPNYATNLVAVYNGPTMQKALTAEQQFIAASTTAQKPLFIDPSNKTAAQLAQLGYGMTGYAFGFKVAHIDDNGYDVWRFDAASQGYFLETYGPDSPSGLPALILRFDKSFQWKETWTFDKEKGTYSEAPVGFESPESALALAYLPALSGVDGTVLLAASESGYWTDGGFIRTGVTLATGDSSTLVTGPAGSRILEGFALATDAGQEPSITVTPLDSGLTATSVPLPNGVALTTVRDDDRRVIRVEESFVNPNGTTTTRAYDRNGALTGLSVTASDGNLIEKYIIASSPNGGIRVELQDGTGRWISVTTAHTDERGIFERSVTVPQADGTRLITTTDVNGTVTGIGREQIFDDGSSIVATELPSGLVRTVTRDSDQTIVRTEELETTAPGETVSRLFDGNNNLIQQTTARTSEGRTYQIIARPDGSEVRIVKEAGVEISRLVIPSYVQTLASAVSDATSLINAIKSGDELPQLASGIKLLNTLDRTQSIPGLNEVNAVAQGILSVYNLHNAFDGGGSDLAKVSSTATMVSATNAALMQFGLGSPALNTFLNGSSNGLLGAASSSVPILPAIGLITAIKAGDPIGAAMSLGTMLQGGPFLTTPLGLVLIAASLYKALQEPPEAWGVGTFKFGDGTDLVFDTQGESFGKDRVNLLMLGNGQSPTNPDGSPNPNYFSGLKGYLEQGIADAAQANPEDLLGIIPQRLPTLYWREARQDQPGYAITDIDPVTGEQRYPFLRYGDDWMPYNADATDPEQRRSIFESLVLSAVAREAVAPMWEVRTAKMQQDVGDPHAGLTEEERAARRGLGASVDPLTNRQLAGEFRPIALDLDGDGRITTVANADNDRAFNWDGSGFDKQVGWVGAGEGMLFLDRNPNGLADSGRELFSNSLIADAAKGVRGLAWVDANADGVINAADPVFNELRLWQDADGDAIADFSELKRLDALGITELDYNNNRFTVNGNLQSMQSVALETSATGQRQSDVPSGIKVEFDDGRVVVYPTRVSDASRNPRVAAVSDGSAVEGSAMDFTVTLNVRGSVVTTVALGVAAGSAGEADLQLPIEVSFNGGASFVALTDGLIDVPVGVQQFVARVRTVDDSTVEPIESFTLLAATAANAAPVGGTGTLVDNEGEAALSISGPASVSEAGGTLTYTVTLSNPSATPVTVSYATTSGTAVAGDDFAGVSGQLTFAPGETSKTFTVALGDNQAVEATEAFSVQLSGAVGASIAVPSVTTTILDDDTPAGDVFTAGDDDIGVFYEDVNELPSTAPVTMPVAWSKLFANDQFNGSSDGLSIVEVANGQHVSVTLDTANREVLVTPEVNYAGQASFQYTVQSSSGETRVATAFLTFAEVNDAPVVTYQINNRTIFGYGVLGTRVVIGADESSFETVSLTNGAGLPFYQPYRTVSGQTLTYLDFGESGGIWERGPLVDTLIPKDYFDREYARLEALQSQGSENGPMTGIEIVLDGVRYFVPTTPQTYLHSAPVDTEIDNDGRITASDPDGGQFRYVIAQDGLYGTASINETTGEFTYTGRRYVENDALGNLVGQNVDTDDHTRYEVRETDVFTIKVIDDTDPSGNTFTMKDVSVTHFGPKPNPDIQSGAKKPIAIDLNGDGFHFTDVDDSNVFFDVNGDGWRRRIAWNNPNDGFIAYDKNGDGKIDSFDEISFVPYKPDGQTDLEGLRAFDTNNDGVFSAADEKWASFGVWQDADSDGVSDPGEFRSLSDLGIQSVGLTSDGQFRVINGQTVHGTAVATRTDGSTLSIADVSLRYRNETKLTTPDGNTATVPAPMIQPGTEFDGTPDKDLVLGTTGSDMFRTGDGDDVIMDDFGNDGVQAGAGDDLIYTGLDNDVIDAGTGNDVVFAGVGNDLVFGDDGDDMLMLEGGNDVAFGGAGQDFIAGGDGNDAISGDAGDDKLFGEGGWDALFGQDGDDELWGLDGNDLLDGGDGRDLLVGGAGDDAMEGGAGDDTYEVDSTGDTVVELLDGGVDTVRASIDYALADTLENLTLIGAQNLRGDGNDADNVLVGNDGNNTLRGFGGNDVLDGGAGVDRLVGGSGDDTYVVDNAGDMVVESAHEGTDTVRSRISVTLTGNVENLTLIGINAINGTGNNLDNTLTGNSAGNVLDGGAGADTMKGGFGNDRYVVDSLADEVVELAGEGYDTVVVNGLENHTLAANVESLELGTGSVNGAGNALDNVLIGNTLSNRLDGGAGADIMVGGSGDDTYVVDNANDTVIETVGNGVDTALSSVSHALAANVENLTLTGTAGADGSGNQLANTLVGNAGNNRLDGGAGADIMIGGAGDDRYVVDSAGDQVVELAGTGAGLQAEIDLVKEALGKNSEMDWSASVDPLVDAIVSYLRARPGQQLTWIDVAQHVEQLGLADAWMATEFASTIEPLLALDFSAESAGGDDTVYASVSYALPDNVENLVLIGAANIDGTGNSLNNVLIGNVGNNTLDGGGGADRMAGGAGDDLYVVDAAGDVVVEQADEGTDGVVSSISYALGANVENLTLTGVADIEGVGNELDNILAANDAGNVLRGLAGDDALIGGSGNDTLDGGSGADLMQGGDGDDTYVVDQGDDQVIEGNGEDFDRVASSVDYTLTDNVEQLTLTGMAVRGTGNALDNVLVGNDQANVLDGRAGADRMEGGLGDDTYFVDNASDAVIEAANAGNDTVLSSVTHSLAAHVENLTLTGAASIDATGNELANVLIGNGGDNRLDGRAGADTMAGGAGDDSYVVDEAGDDVVEFAGEGFDTVTASIDYTLTDNVEQLTLTGSALNATGNALDNLLFGNDQANLLDGGAGADRMAGALDDDTYIVDNAGDVVVESANAGNDTVLSSVSYKLAANVENLTLTGTGDVDATGNELANVLIGNAGNNRLDGGAEADAMLGGAGDDNYVVDHMADQVIEATGEGFDQVESSVDYTLTDNVEQLTLTGTAINGTGNALDNLLFGNDQANVLDGGAGADRMAGALGDDTYIVDNVGDVVVESANAGTDTVEASVSYALAANVENLTLVGAGNIDAAGNELDNVLIGNAGNNRLDGAAGADTMAGGAGDDSYVVDNAGDLVVESAGQGFDQVHSSISYALTDNVEQLTLTGSAVRGSGNALDNVLFGNDQANVIDGGTGADRMTGGRGDDTYIVDNAGDSVDEAANEGADTVEASVSYSLAANVENLTLVGAGDIDATGNELDNMLVGNAGNNLLDGGTGADTMIGGAGDDSYIVDDAGDTVIESAGQGFDRVSSSINYVLTANVEQLTLTGGALHGTGNDLDNLLFGNDEANVLDGASGADQISGGLGDDRYVIDNAADHVVEAAGEGNDTVIASVNYTLSNNVENLILTGNAVRATGNGDANVLVGNALANMLVGGAGNDVLAGGLGDDTLDGGSGDDLYLYNQTEGRDVVVDESGTDTLRFGAGITLDSVAGRIVTVGGETKVFLSILSADGTEQQDQGIELASTGGIERFEFADGTVTSLSDLMITSRSLSGDSKENTITGDRRDETIEAGSGDDTVYARTGHDVVFGGSGHDKLFGEGGDDRLYGQSGDDQLWGGAGTDRLDGSSGKDLLVGGSGGDHLDGGSEADTLDGGDGRDVLIGGSGEDQLFAGAGDDVLDGGTDSDLLAAGGGNDVIRGDSGRDVIVAGEGDDSIDSGTDRDFVDAGSGDDVIVSGTSSDFIAGGRGNDTIDTGTDQDLLAFNRGDGTDTVLGTGWDRDTVSLGGGIRYADLSLRKAGNDLVFELGDGESITFKDWYTSNGRHSVDTLQVVTVGADYDASSGDRLKNRKVVSFDFEQLANRFDQARAANPGMTSWAIAGELNSFFKASSDTKAIGGDLAYRYATTGSYGDLDWIGVRGQLGGMSGTAWQTLAASTAVNPWTALQAGLSLVADQTVGLPSPITPMAALTADELAFAALNASGRRPSWMGNQPGPILP